MRRIKLLYPIYETGTSSFMLHRHYLFTTGLEPVLDLPRWIFTSAARLNHRTVGWDLTISKTLPSAYTDSAMQTNCSPGGIRTHKSPASKTSRCTISLLPQDHYIIVRSMRFELTHPFGPWLLIPSCLPIPARSHFDRMQGCSYLSTVSILPTLNPVIYNVWVVNSYFSTVRNRLSQLVLQLDEHYIVTPVGIEPTRLTALAS